jgi:tubulin-specific chaperone A
MPAPSALAIKTSAVVRLIKEEAQYHKELVADEQRLQKMEASGNEDEYAIKQQVA